MSLHEKFMWWFAKQLSPRFKLIVLSVMAGETSTEHPYKYTKSPGELTVSEVAESWHHIKLSNPRD